MIKLKEWLLIKDYLDMGYSISYLARMSGHDRKTIRKIKNSPYPFVYKQRKPL